MGADSGLALGGSKATGRLIVHATNIHNGGGAKLLNAILGNLSAVGEFVLFCDRRMRIDPSIESAIVIHRVEPTLLARFVAERRLRDTARIGDVVLAFGNLPPVYRLNAHTVLFLQNRYLVDPKMSFDGFDKISKLRFFVERIWLRSRLRNVDRTIVQTHTMSALFEKAFGCPAEVMALSPMHDARPLTGNETVASRKQYDFIYVSSGEPHKNHRTLIEAWSLLAKSGARPSLALTLSVDKNGDILELARAAIDNFGAKIINLGHVSASGVDTVYDSSAALIFPSTGESFGLPLLEAAERGVPILASELDYVRDLVDPVQTFDPRSPRSIARAVCRFLNLPSDQNETVGPAEFLGRICTELS
jgi:glycosyltransferase involved in cell wall biosynthesis